MREIFYILCIFAILFHFSCAKKEEKKVEKPKKEEIIVPITKPEAQKHLQDAYKFMNEGKVDDAIKEFEKALKIQPDNGIILVGIAAAHEQKGNKEKALFYYKEALKYQPTREDCKSAIARLEGKQILPPVENPIPESVDEPIEVKEHLQEKVPMKISPDEKKQGKVR